MTLLIKMPANTLPFFDLCGNVAKYKCVACHVEQNASSCIKKIMLVHNYVFLGSIVEKYSHCFGLH